MPQCQAQLLRYHNLAPAYPALMNIHSLNMVPLKCNDPMVTGYSACYLGHIRTLHAHVKGDDLGFYKRFDAYQSHGVCIYMPLDPGELLTEIWLRRDSAFMGVILAVGASHMIETFGPRSNSQVSSELIEPG